VERVVSVVRLVEHGEESRAAMIKSVDVTSVVDAICWRSTDIRNSSRASASLMMFFVTTAQDVSLHSKAVVEALPSG
jgi:hypothetical protein